MKFLYTSVYSLPFVLAAGCLSFHGDRSRCMGTIHQRTDLFRRLVHSTSTWTRCVPRPWSSDHHHHHHSNSIIPTSRTLHSRSTRTDWNSWRSTGEVFHSSHSGKDQSSALVARRLHPKHERQTRQSLQWFDTNIDVVDSWYASRSEWISFPSLPTRLTRYLQSTEKDPRRWISRIRRKTAEILRKRFSRSHTSSGKDPWHSSAFDSVAEDN